MAQPERRMTVGRRRFAETERMRNTVLSFLNKNDGASPYAIGKVLDTTAERTSQLLIRMVKIGEVRFVENAGVRRDGRPCRKYYATVERTVSAEELLAKMGNNFNGGAPPKLVIPKLPKTVFGGLLV